MRGALDGGLARVGRRHRDRTDVCLRLFGEFHLLIGDFESLTLNTLFCIFLTNSTFAYTVV